jgi:hypothetical protein
MTCRISLQCDMPSLILKTALLTPDLFLNSRTQLFEKPNVCLSLGSELDQRAQEAQRSTVRQAPALLYMRKRQRRTRTPCFGAPGCSAAARARYHRVVTDAIRVSRGREREAAELAYFRVSEFLAIGEPSIPEVTPRKERSCFPDPAKRCVLSRCRHAVR